MMPSPRRSRFSLLKRDRASADQIDRIDRVQPTVWQRLSAWWQAKPLGFRRKALSGLVALHYVVIIGMGTLYNVQLYVDMAADRAAVDRAVAAVSSLPAVTEQLAVERAAHEVLRVERGDMYEALPELAGVPVIVQQLETLGRSVGGEVRWIEYAPPRWDEARGRVRVTLMYAGDFASSVRYMTSAVSAVDNLHINQFEIEQSGSDPLQLRLHMDVSLDVLGSRPTDGPPWQQTHIGVRDDVYAGPGPFTPPPSLWSLAADVGVHAPRLALAGLARQGGGHIALLSVNGSSYVVRTGEHVAGVTILGIDDESVLIRADRREARLTLGE